MPHPKNVHDRLTRADFARGRRYRTGSLRLVLLAGAVIAAVGGWLCTIWPR